MLTIQCTFLLVVILSIAFIEGQFHDGFSHASDMDNLGKFMIYWRPAENDSDYIIFEVQVRTKGWIGVGFGPIAGMTNADIVIMWIDRDQKGQISDRHGPKNGNGYPDIDKRQDYELISASENATHTIIRFRRKQNTCDEEEDWKITTDTIRLLWSYNDEKPISAQDLQRHSERGARSIRLREPASSNQASTIFNQPGVTHMDFYMDKVTIPENTHTIYWCKIFEIPKFVQKRQVIGYEMKIQPGNEKFLHHATFHGCDYNMSEYLNRDEGCYSQFGAVIGLMKYCNPVIFGWAIGSDPFAYPDNMASIYYGDVYDYILGEFHYDNSDFVKDIVDSSGIRLYMTEQLRPIETSGLTFAAGSEPRSFLVPPFYPNFMMTAYCGARCTNNLGDDKIYIIGGFLHSHTIGAKLRVRHIRNGIELQPILQDNYYDFNYQSPMMQQNPSALIAGDELILECEYDSSLREYTTTYGQSTHDEMCMAFMEYYPRRKGMTALCASSPQMDGVFATLGAQNWTIGNNRDSTRIIDRSGNNVSFDEWITNFDWYLPNAIDGDRLALVKIYERYLREHPQGQYCNIANDTDPNWGPSSFMPDKNPIVTRPLDNTDYYCKNLLADETTTPATTTTTTSIANHLKPSGWKICMTTFILVVLSIQS